MFKVDPSRQLVSRTTLVPTVTLTIHALFVPKKESRMSKGVCQLTARNATARFLSPLGVCLGVCFILNLFVGLPAGFGQQSSKVGILDPQAVIEQSIPGKKVLSTLKEHATVRQKLLASDEEELKKIQDQIQKGTKSEAEIKEMQGQLQTRLEDYQRRAKEFQQEMALKQQELVLEFMNKIETATKAVAEKHDFSLIIDKGSAKTLKIVLFAAKGLDITDEVVKEVNQRYK